MFRQSATSMEGSHIAATAVVGAVAALFWFMDISLWAVLILFAGFLIGMVACFFPARCELIADESGLAWGKIGPAKEVFPMLRCILLVLAAFLPATGWPASRLTNVSVRSTAGAGAD